MLSHQVSILTVFQVKELLKISLNEANMIMDSATLPTITIGCSKRVLRKDLYLWLSLNDSIANSG